MTAAPEKTDMPSATHCPFDYEKGEYESNEGYIWRLKRHAKSLEDACAASQTPPNPQAGAPSAYATMPPECCGNTMGFSRCEGCPDALPRKTAKEQFDGLIDERAFNDIAPLERLRFFCSLVINGQDWLDIEPFFSALETPLSETAPKPRGAYQPLTEEQIETWREHWKNAPRFTDDVVDDSEVEELDRLCSMAVNCLLYAEEIQRLRDRPVSATRLNTVPIAKMLLAQRDECADALRALVAVVDNNFPMPAGVHPGSPLDRARKALANVPTYEQRLRNIAEGIGMTYEELMAAMKNRSDDTAQKA